MSSIQGDDVHSRPDQSHDSVSCVWADPDGGTNSEASPLVLGGVRVLARLLDVLDGDQSAKVEMLVHYREFLNLVLLQDVLGILQGCAYGRRDQIIPGHGLGNRPVHIVLEAEVPVGDDPHQEAVYSYRHARDMVVLHELQGIPDHAVL